MTRCAFIIDPALPRGLIANTAAILAMSLGRSRPELIGADLRDRDGALHAGITSAVLPILAADGDAIRELRARAAVTGGVAIIDVTDVAQRSKTYGDYADKLAALGDGEIVYFGLCIHGTAAAVRSLTGQLPLLR